MRKIQKEFMTFVPPKNPSDKDGEINYKNCHRYDIPESGLVRCQMDVHWCEWGMQFGNIMFCKYSHADKEQS